MFPNGTGGVWRWARPLRWWTLASILGFAKSNAICLVRATGSPEIVRVIQKAFMLGAGLGTRLRPLTDRLPKPLVPLFHRPLIEWGMLACRDLGVSEFAINTHHLPEAWTVADEGLKVADWRPGPWKGANGEVATRGTWQGCPVDLFHENELLETGGGIKNIADWVGQDDVLIHNGDIYSSMPLKQLTEAHASSENLATLALRSDGVAKHVAHADGQVVDIRAMLGKAEGTHVFSGLYCFSPGLLDYLPAGEKVSVIPAFLELIKAGKLGAVVIDEGIWFDLGNPESYLAAHRDLALAEAVHPGAQVAADALVESSVIGPGAEVGAGAVVRDSVVWPSATVMPGESLMGEIRMPAAQ